MDPVGPAISKRRETGAKQRGNDGVSNDNRSQGGKREASKARRGVDPERGEREGGEVTDVGGGEAAFSEPVGMLIHGGSGVGLNPFEVQGGATGGQEVKEKLEKGSGGGPGVVPEEAEE